jgi:hypothetical protein
MKNYYGVKCTICGKYIAYQDIIDKKASTVLVSPLSEFSDERIEAFCKDHNGPISKV